MRFGHRTPPAVFPAILGLLGLGLAWRRAVAAWGAPPGIGEAVLGVGVALWAFAAASYLAKLRLRPGVLREELMSLPGRAGLAAGTVGGLAVAAALAPVFPVAAKLWLVAALLAQAALAVAIARLLRAGPPEGRRATPVWHLSFAGFVVAPLAAAPLGWTGLAAVLVWVSLAVALAIHAASLRQLLRETPLPPLRPLLAIHAAPLSVAGSGLALLDGGLVSDLLLLAATAVLLALAFRFPWLAAAGFTPLWGALTFPLATWAGLSGLAALRHPWLALPSALALGLVSVAVLAIVWKVLSLWPGGRLAQKTGAAAA